MKKTEKLSQEEIKKEVEKRTKKYMKSITSFLITKGGGVEVPEEWYCSVMLLESYFRQFVELDIQIQQMDSIIMNGRYGPVVSPLCTARDKAATRLEAQMKEMGITLKSGIKLNVVEPKKEMSALDKFFKDKGKKEVR